MKRRMSDGDMYVDDMGELVVLVHPEDTNLPKALAITGPLTGTQRPWGENNGLLNAIFVVNLNSVAIAYLAKRKGSA